MHAWIICAKMLYKWPWITNKVFKHMFRYFRTILVTRNLKHRCIVLYKKYFDTFNLTWLVWRTDGQTYRHYTAVNYVTRPKAKVILVFFCLNIEINVLTTSQYLLLVTSWSDDDKEWRHARLVHHISQWKRVRDGRLRCRLPARSLLLSNRYKDDSAEYDSAEIWQPDAGHQEHG